MTSRRSYSSLPWLQGFFLGMCMHAGTALCVMAQDTDIRTFQSFRIERDGGAPASTILFTTPTTAITPYSLIWPYDPPTAGSVLVTNGSTTPFMLSWSLPTGSLLEIESSGSRNLRRSSSTLSPGSPAGVPGYVANDFQAGRTSASQTASGDRSTILGGASNTASGSKAAVGGGLGNSAGSTTDVAVGGTGNSVNSSEGGILGGTNNTVSSNDGTIIGGSGNSSSSNRGFIGGGTGNTMTSNQAFIGGGSGNNNTGDNAGIFGGYQNTVTGTHATALGGMNNTVNSTNRATLAGGDNNNASSNYSFVGGGSGNTSSSSGTVVFGGTGNSVTNQYGTIVGGASNSVSNGYGFIGGGQSNVVSAFARGSIFGGQSNTAGADNVTLLGGQNGSVTGAGSVVMGGRALTLSAADQAGFNGAGVTTSFATANEFLVANADIWIANNDGTPREARLFENYGTNGAFPGANTNYVAFNAPSATANDYDNTYTLPDRTGAVSDLLTIAAAPAPTTTSAATTWAAAPINYRSSATAINADLTTIAGAVMDNVEFVRVTSNNTPVNRRTSLSNGVTNGMLLTMRVVSSAPGPNPDRGIRLRATDANLRLAGNADYDMQQGDTVMLVWDDADQIWIEVGRTNQ